MADLPIGYTSHFNLALWKDGDNPGATALNGNMTSIDTVLNDLSNNVAVVAIAPLSQSGKNLTLNYDTSNLKLDNIKLNTIQNISTSSNVQFNKIGVGVSASNVYQLDISGNQHVYGSIYVDGDIHLKGWVAQDNYTELTILDNKIKLNRSGSDASSIGSGLFIEGDNYSTAASITYNGSNWVLDKDLTVNNETVNGVITLTKNGRQISKGNAGFIVGYNNNTENFYDIEGTTGYHYFRNNSGSAVLFSIGPTIKAYSPLDFTGVLRLRNDIQLLNKAAGGWLPFATRNTSGSEAVYDLTNIGNVTLSGNLTVNGVGINTFKSAIQFNGSSSTIESTGADNDISLKAKSGTTGRLVINYNGGSGGISMRNGGTTETFKVTGTGEVLAYGGGSNYFAGKSGFGTVTPHELVSIGDSYDIGTARKGAVIADSANGGMLTIGSNATNNVYFYTNTAGRLDIATVSAGVWYDSTLTINTGKVGIGGNPSTQLHQVGGIHRIQTTDTVGLQIGYVTSSGNLNFSYYDTGNYAKIQAQDASAYRTISINPDGGNIGIGTITANQKLEINGSMRLTYNTAGVTPLSGIEFYNSYTSSQDVLAKIYLQRGPNGHKQGELRLQTNDGTNGLSDRLIIDKDGKVGVGRTPTNYLFEVNGDIEAVNGWLRTTGNAGWYSQTYGGGWYMTDSTWIRNYNSKALLLDADFQQTTNKSIYNNFISGIFGTGWKIDQGNLVNNESYLEVDNIMVRNTLRTHIFQKDVVKVTNGYLYVSDSGVISSFSSASNRVGFSDEKSATFASGTLLWAKDIKPGDTLPSSVKFTIGTVYTSSNGETVYNVSVNSGDLGNLFVGETSARISGGSLLMDASSAGSPYLDVVLDGITKTRLGNLSGWTSTVYGTYQGWGLASENVYLSGNANIVGTLTAGDSQGFGNTFYVGKISKNLIANSGVFKDTSSWSISTASGTGSMVAIEQDSTYGSVIKMVINPLSAWQYGSNNSLSSRGFKFVIGKPYTLSITLKADTAFTFNIGFKDGNALNVVMDKQANVTTSFNKYVFTFTPSITGNQNFLYLSGFQAGNAVYIANVQLEEGSYATPYQPTDGVISSSSLYGMWSTAGGFGGTIQNPAISLSDYGIIVRKQDATAGWRNNNTISIGYYGSTEWGIKGRDGSGNAVFDLGDTNQIAGWTFTNTQLYRAFNFNHSEGICLSTGAGYINGTTSQQNNWGAVHEGLSVGGNSAGAYIIHLGRVRKRNSGNTSTADFSDNRFGIQMNAYNIGDIGSNYSPIFEVSCPHDSSNYIAQIAGWNFDNKKLYNGTDVVLDAYNKKVSVFNDAVKMYYSASSDYGIKDSAGRFQLGSTNKIAGWTFDTSKIFNNNVSIESAGNLLNSSGGWNFYNDGRGNIGTGDTGISWTSGGAVTLGKNVTLSWAKTTGINLLQGNFDLDWKVGAAPSLTGFPLNGSNTSTENGIVSVAGPFGVNANVWACYTDGLNNGDGGFYDGTTFNIDKTKTYRYAIWFRVINDNNGNVYFGCATDSTVSSLTGNSSDSVNTNPYFLAHLRNNFTNGKWYLAVGYIHPAGYTGTSFYGAVYDGATGKAVTSLTDYKFMSTATTAKIRAFMYYCTTTNPVTYFYNPMVHEVNGSEPSIYDLLGMNVTTLNNYMVASPRIVGGNDGSNYVELSSNGLKAFNGGNQKVHVSSSGDGWFGASNKFYWDASGNVTAGGWTLNNGYLSSTGMNIFGGTYPFIEFYDQSNGNDYMTLGRHLYDGSWHDDWNGMIFRANSQNWFQMYSTGDGSTRVARIGGWDFRNDSIYTSFTSSAGHNQWLRFATNTFSTGDYFYGGSNYLRGLSLNWLNSNNAGTLVFGQMMASGTTLKNGYLGIQMMSWQGTEFFALGANVDVTSGDDTRYYCKIAGWQFNASSLYKNTDSNNGVRLDSSDTFSGLAVKSGGYDVLKVGKYTAGSLLNVQRTVSGTWSGIRTTGFNGSINNGVVGVGQITSPYVINSGYNYATVTYTANESLQNKWVRIRYTVSVSSYDDSIGCYTSDYQLSSNYPISLTGRTWCMPDGDGAYKTYDSGWFFNTSTGNFLTLSLSNSQDNGAVASPYGFAGGSLSVTIETKDSLPAADLSPNTLRIYNYGGLEGLFYDSDGLKVKGKSLQVGNWELREGTPATGKKGGNLEVYFNGSLVTTLATAPSAPAI